MKVRSGYLFQKRPGGNWFVRIMVDGKPKVESTGTPSRREAERRKADIVRPYLLGDRVDVLKAVSARLSETVEEIERIEEEQNPPPFVAMVWVRFMASQSRPDSGDSTLKQYHAEWKRFESWLSREHPAAVFLHDVTPGIAADYARDLTSAKVSASTFNQHRNLLRLVWRVLADEARLTANPWDKVTPKKLTALASRKRAVTPDQYRALLTATADDSDLHDLLLLLAWTGLRLADGVLLKWGSIDFTKRVISLAPLKTARRQGKLVHIPMFPAVLEVLNRRQDGHPLRPGAYVFAGLAEGYQHDPSSLSKRISSAFDRAGMATTEERAERGRKVVVYGAHSLRHFFATQATAAGLPGAVIKSITGHATDGMLEHYQQLGADIAAELSTRIGGTSTTPAPLLPQADPVAAIKERIRALTERLNAESWHSVKAELAELAEN
jgi:integrase